MSIIPDFSGNEISIIQSTVDERYRRAVCLEPADAEVKPCAVSDVLTGCPTAFWHENGTNFSIFKTGDSRYRSQLLDREGDMYRTDREEHDVAVASLPVQADLEGQRNQVSGRS